MYLSYYKTEYRPISDLQEFQNDLKTLSPADAKKLRRQIERNGFAAPFSVWESPSGLKTLDGHQRLRVLKQMAADGETIPDLPCNFIKAKDEKQAREILLSLAAAYGQVTEKGLLDFGASFNFSLPDLKENFRFPEIDFESMVPPNFKPGGVEEQPRLDKKNPVKCPECGAEFVPK